VGEWGEPANVAAAVDAHNAVARAVAAAHPEVTFVDQRALMPVGRETFDDCCHLTAAGCRRWVENLIAGLDLPALAGHRAARRPADPPATARVADTPVAR
jgi:hypothetical protein